MELRIHPEPDGQEWPSYKKSQPRSVVQQSLAVASALLVALAAGGGRADDGPVDFRREVEPILAARCLECHGDAEPEGGLRLTSRENALLRGDSGKPTVVPGRGEQSELLRRVTADPDERMPPEGEPLSNEEVAVLRRWIDAGAEWPQQAEPLHWSYVKPARPATPQVTQPHWIRNEIDAFVLAQLEAQSPHLSPSPVVEPGKLLRRVYLDLTGLPPSVAEQDAFLADPSQQRYEEVVDRLLESPQYGEKWGRQWLDLARYADSNGFQADQFRSMWAWRDWVIAAINADMPFDQFTIEQLAGDLLPAATIDQQIATGFQRCTTCNVEAGVDPEENRVNQVVDRVNTLGTVWLGTTLECAQCHNHKYDPFSQQDYYQLFAFFNNTPLEVDRPTGEGVAYEVAGPKLNLPESNETRNKRDEVSARRDALSTKIYARKSEMATQLASLSADEPQAAELSDQTREILAIAADKRTPEQEQQLAEQLEKSDPELSGWMKRLASLEKQLAQLEPDSTLVMVEMDAPRDTMIFKRGSFLEPLASVEPATPAALHEFQVPQRGQELADKESNGATRLDLSQWLVSPENPLVGRVTVNRWWSEFFGRGLVATPEDFGTQGDRPTHPDLLDWLAVEFVESGWSRKHIHRLIVTSATYQQDSSLTAELLQRDPDNKLLARGPRFRLPAETIRDNALAISGLLSHKMTGPPVYPPQPERIWRHVGRNAPKYETERGEDRFRRGVYVVWRRSAPYPSFVNFDAPDRGACVVNRSRTNTPLQALTLLNDPAYVEMTAALARRLESHKAGSNRERVEYGFRLCTSRQPTTAEATTLLDLYEAELARLSADPAAVESLTKPDAGSAPSAAWFFVANALLNLDETVTKD